MGIFLVEWSCFLWSGALPNTLLLSDSGMTLFLSRANIYVHTIVMYSKHKILKSASFLAARLLETRTQLKETRILGTLAAVALPLTSARDGALTQATMASKQTWRERCMRPAPRSCGPRYPWPAGVPVMSGIRIHIITLDYI